MFDVSFFSALFGGMLTFLAPCTLPLVPAYIGFLGGVSSVDAANRRGGDALLLRRRILTNAVLFVVGFSIIFMFAGLASGALGKYFVIHRAVLSEVGGIIVVVFGVSLLGIIRLPAIFKGMSVPSWLHPGTPFSSLLLGMLFALGWSPCFGPIIGTILVLAATSGMALHGAFLLFIYSLGLAIPFLLLAYFYGNALSYIRPIVRYLPWISRGAGVLLIVIGALLVAGQFGLLNTWASDIFGGGSYERLEQFM